MTGLRCDAVDGLRRRWMIARDAVRLNRRARAEWQARPDNAFTTDGYAVVPDLLDRAECERLVALADDLLTESSRVISGNCYTWVKAQAAHGRNTQVREILNVNEVDPGVAALLDERVVQREFEARLGEPVELYGFSIQVDGTDTRTKRGFHVDTLHPPVLKAFIYLTDVHDEADGPYTIIPGSHRHYVRKAINDFINAVSSSGRRDMHHVVADRRQTPVLGPAGTMILSTQDAMHKGGSEHSGRPRYALIAHGTTARHFAGGPLTEGRALVEGP